MGYLKIKLSVLSTDVEYLALIRGLSAARKLSATVRDSMMLYASLQRGETDVLLRLFPFLRAALGQSSASPAGSASGSPKPLAAAKSLPAPVDPDGDLVEIKRTSDTSGGKNLLLQLLQTTQTDYSAAAAAGGD